jgi:HK97 family phage prohead protease
MKVYYRSADTVTIEGYVNAVERNSKPLYERGLHFIERIASGAFKRAIRRASNIQALLNHDKLHEIANTSSGTLELEEDNIGLRAKLTTSDPEVVKDANEGNLVGWSFGFREIPEETKQMIDPETGLPLRKINNLELIEVSLLNRKRTPAYSGTLVEVRSDGTEEASSIFYSSENEEEVEHIREEAKEETEEEVTEEVVTSDVEELREEPEETKQEEEKVEAPVVKEVSSEYYARYKNMIAEMRK